jgi:XTP/dITP diphosphohydrolase
MPPLLILGTRNRKKRDELAAILRGLALTLGDLADRPDLPELEETEPTFAGNAQLKAVGYAKLTGEWVLADDSGLVVPALGGRPGVLSARYAGRQGDDAANNQKLLAELAALPDTPGRRDAYYVCVLALANPQGEVVATVEGRCHGEIVRQPRGSGGFGYDPLFLIREYHRTFGELGPAVKRAISHRARALAQLRPVLVKQFGLA